jgi:hypothetical protein
MAIFDALKRYFNNRTGNLQLLDRRTNTTHWAKLHPHEIGNYYDFQHPHAHIAGNAGNTGVPVDASNAGITEHLYLPAVVTRSPGGNGGNGGNAGKGGSHTASSAMVAGAKGVHRILTT